MSEFETPDFVTEIEDDGSVRIPSSYLGRVGLSRGMRVSVRVTELSLSKELSKRGVTESEVDMIGSMQFEPRENVLAFLASEGVLRAQTRSAARLRTWLRSAD